MSRAPGTLLGHYEIVARLGGGGMGEVYRARDTRLGREVAIKFLLEEVAEDQERLTRFEREARALAALNHPNVATIHGLERHDSELFLVMELVEGEELTERIARGPIPLDEAIPLFVQLSEGLAAAHAAGIVHRDLKPANIKLTGDGLVKILDFGLAKTVASLQPTGSDLSQSPTFTGAATRRGEILGTAAYMSPEQAKGEAIDKRTDIWAFGCCLFEALAGRRAFAGEDASEILAAILRSEVGWEALPASTPWLVRRLLRRCLTKDPRQRLHDVSDVRIELAEYLEEAGGSGARPAETTTGRRSWRLAGTLLVVGIVGFVGGLLVPGCERSSIAKSPVRRFTIAPPPGASLGYRVNPTLAISRDGRRIAVVGQESGVEGLWLYELDRSALPRRLALAAGVNPWGPFFSFASDRLGFFDPRMVALPLDGGEVQVLSDIPGLYRGAWWQESGDILFAHDRGGGISRLDAVGRGTSLVIGAWAVYPQPLPGSKAVLFTMPGTPPSVAVASPGQESPTVLAEDGFYGRYSASGHVIFAQRDTLLAMPFDPETLRSGTPVRIITDLVTSRLDSFAEFAISEEGTLAYLRGASELDRWIVRLTPGQPQQRLHEAPAAFDIRSISVEPQGRFVTASVGGDIWVLDVERGSFEHITTDQSVPDWLPIFSEDGRTISWGTIRDGAPVIVTHLRGSTAAPEVIVTAAPGIAYVYPGSLSANGELLYVKLDPENGEDIWSIELGREEGARPFLETAKREFVPRLSPDGGWVAYTSDESGNFQIFLAAYPDAERRRFLANGWCPRWSRDGLRLFYEGRTQIFAMRRSSSDSMEFSPPELFHPGPVDDNCSWDIAPDGRSLIAIERRATPQLVVIQNFFGELERLVPTP